jgi:hypothetical protein
MAGGRASAICSLDRQEGKGTSMYRRVASTTAVMVAVLVVLTACFAPAQQQQATESPSPAATLAVNPSPTATPAPTSSPTPEPTATPAPTTAAPTATPAPTTAATATPAPKTTPTPAPKTATPAPKPTATAAPTASPTPTPTPTASPTPLPVANAPACPTTGLAICGRVTDASTGAAIPQACITLGPPIRCWTTTGGDGRYVINLSDVAAQSGTTWDLYALRTTPEPKYAQVYSGVFPVSGIVTKDFQLVKQ